MATDALSITLAALADPTRRGILAALAEGAATVKDLAAPFRLSPPTISKHLKVLERAGLITRGKRAQWRPCSLRAEPLHEAAEWIEHLREAWETNYTRLDAVLDELTHAAPRITKDTR